LRSRNAVLDPDCPCRLPTLYRGFPHYVLTKSDREWTQLRAKAKQNDAEAEWLIGECYSDGCRDKAGNIRVRRSARKAVAWLRRSAEHGYVSAQNTLGVYLGGGYGVEADPQEALMWLRRAHRADESCASLNIAITYRENGNLRRAVSWFRKAVASGDGAALIQLGIHLYWGKGVRTNHANAIRCFRKATRSKNISECDRDDAFFYLAVAYLAAVPRKSCCREPTSKTTMRLQFVLSRLLSRTEF
jgi:TPR repeat protein